MWRYLDIVVCHNFADCIVCMYIQTNTYQCARARWCHKLCRHSRFDWRSNQYGAWSYLDFQWRAWYCCPSGKIEGSSFWFQGVVNKSHEFYRHWVPNDNDQFIGTYPSEHAWITSSFNVFLISTLVVLYFSAPLRSDKFGSRCDYLGLPYINNCNFDAAGSMLQHIYSNNLLPPVRNTTGQLLTFEQVSLNAYSF